jgi:hypothetical protein
MGGLLRYLALNAQVRAGLSLHALIWAGVAALCAAVGFLFLLIAAFFWLADRYDVIKAGFILGTLFVVIALVSGLGALIIRRRSITRARAELVQRQTATAGWLDPKLLAAGLQIGQGIGWRRLGSLAVAALVAAAVAYDWVRDKPPPTGNDSAPEK